MHIITTEYDTSNIIVDQESNQQRTLLLVDDEPSITSCLERIFKRSHYRVIKASSGEEALDILKNENIGVVISDQRMPQMSGIEFLTRVFELYPHIMRIILTGQADMDAVMEAVNSGAVYKFLTKPWESEELAASVDGAFQHYELFKQRQQIMQDIEAANEELQQINETLNKRIEEKSQRLINIAQYDALTGLPNRILFMDRLQQAILNAKHSNKHVAVIVLGLNRFKLVNNSYGTKTGDTLLMHVAERIVNNIHDNDTVARISGDEFAIVINELDSPQDIAHILDEIHKTLSAPFEIAGYELYTQASTGISIYPEDDDCPDNILQNAHTAMHTAKEQGDDAYQFFTSDMHIKISERLWLENELRKAVEQEAFSIQYQPQINIQTNTLVGMESLLRWKHPDRGFISPADFIPVLEETGLITVVGEWILKTVCEQHRAWRETGLHVPRISVNLSVRQFHDDNLLSSIERIFLETDFDPKKYELELEVTESLVIHDIDNVIKVLNQFNKKNIRIAIDDFGTGYASLSYLTRFPIHTLKIDLSFIRRINKGHGDQAIIIAILALAHSIGLIVIAEGVEDRQQLEFLHEHKCDEIQGYFFSRPLVPDDMQEYIKNETHKEIMQSLV